MAFSEIFEFTGAVRGFHVYRKVWKPTEGQRLACFYESGNVFDPFAVKVCEENCDKTIGHLPREISRITKFILDRGAIVTVQLTSNHYRRSPLVQGGLEIKCKISVKTHVTFNKKVLERYRSLVEELYTEPKDEEIIGSFIYVEDDDSGLSGNYQSATHKDVGTAKTRKKNETIAKKKNEANNKDIRTFFKKNPSINVVKNLPSEDCNKVIEID